MIDRKIYNALKITGYPVYGYIGEGEKGIIYLPVNIEDYSGMTGKEYKKSRYQLTLYSDSNNELSEMENAVHHALDYKRIDGVLYYPISERVLNSDNGKRVIYILDYYLYGE